MHAKSSAKLGEVKRHRGGNGRRGSEVRRERGAPLTGAACLRTYYLRRATADPMWSATRTVWRALLVRPLLQEGENHQMAVVTSSVTSRVGDVPGDSGTT